MVVVVVMVVGGCTPSKGVAKPGTRHLPCTAFSPYVLNTHSTHVRWELVSPHLTNERKPSLPE